MDYGKLIDRLSRYSEPMIAYKLDADFAAAVIEAKGELESVKHGRCAGCSVPETTAEMIRDLNDTPKLRAENEKLCADLARVTAELNDLRAQWDMYGGDVGITETYKELERVKAERDAAVEYLRGKCRYCKKYLVCGIKAGPHDSCWEWRGIKED